MTLNQMMSLVCQIEIKGLVEKFVHLSQRYEDRNIFLDLVLKLFGFVFQMCDIKADGKKRFLTLKNVQLDQAGEVSYQALNAVTSAMLTVKGNCLSQISLTLFVVVCCKLLLLWVSEN